MFWNVSPNLVGRRPTLHIRVGNPADELLVLQEKDLGERDEAKIIFVLMPD